MKRILLLMLALCTICTTQATNMPKHGVAKKKTIINGAIIPIAQAPYQALIEVNNERGGGVILNSEWILTANHIALKIPGSVRVGVSTLPSSQGQSKQILKIINHPQYVNNGGNPSNDIALIRLTSPLNLTGNDAKAIRLGSKANTTYWNDNTDLYVSGYGNTAYNGTMSPNLSRVNVKVSGTNNPSSPNFISSTYDPNKIDCIGPSTNDACNNDSGGPLVSLGTANPNTPSGANSPLIGIVSSALGANGSVGGGCGQGGRYMKVANYVSWIYQTILEETTPNFVCASTVFTKPNIEVDGMTNWTWSTSTPALLTISGANNGNTVTFNSVPNTNGIGIIVLTLRKADGSVIDFAEKEVWVGRLGNINITSDGTFSVSNSPPNITICKNRGYCMTVQAEPLNNPKYQGVVTSYTWAPAPSGMYLNPSTLPSGSSLTNNKACFGTNTTGTFLLVVTANGGACGSSNKNIYIQANNCGFRVAPNPAQNSVSVIFDNPEIKESIPLQLDLLDEKFGKVMKTMKKSDKEESMLRKDDNKISMDVSDLPRGTYYLHLTFEEKKVEKVKIILN